MARKRSKRAAKTSAAKSKRRGKARAAPTEAKPKGVINAWEQLRRGRLKVARAGKPAAEIVRSSAPLTHETYTHELRREGRQMVLRRVRIDCGSWHR
jgi:hypothetical protein